MPDRIFCPGDVLIPRNQFDTWSVIACDQFTSQPEYWQEAESIVGDNPSGLRLMLPEIYLDEPDVGARMDAINRTMKDYLKGDIFSLIEGKYIYIERSLESGQIRPGLLGVLDLEHYDYRPSSETMIRATEGTVEERLPPRVRVRQEAVLEMPHIVVFIDDADNTVITSELKNGEGSEKLYDFDLMLDGGHISGWSVGGDDAKKLGKQLSLLESPERIREKYNISGDKAPVAYAVGDGNHSLATARLCWESIRDSLSPEERKNHPARFSLVELVNIHDSSIVFEPIHRVLHETRCEGFIDKAIKALSPAGAQSKNTRAIELYAGDEHRVLHLDCEDISSLIDRCEAFIQGYAREFGGRLDYVHDNAAAELGSVSGNVSIILPAFDKSELFPTIMSSGPFPRKSFSIGTAREKRYYLECRAL